MSNNKPPFMGERVRLGDLLTKARSKRCGDSSYPVLSMTMHDGIVRQDDRFKKSIASRDTKSYKVVIPGQLVVGFPIDEGVIYIQKLQQPGIMSPAYQVWDVDESRVRPRYLELALHSPKSMAYYAAKMRGTTARRRSITADNLCALEIPVPSLERQDCIVATFERVGSLLASCEQASECLDSLVKSQFVEMFGDPTTEHDGWLYEPIGNVCQVITGNTPSRKDEANYGDYVEWCKTDNITEARYLTKAAESLSKTGAQKGRVAPAGSVLMACIAGSIKTIGKVAINDRSVAFNQQINALIPMDELCVDYLLWALRLSKNYLCSDVNMQLKGILNKSALSAKKYVIPPFALQQQFASFVAEVDKSRFVARKSAELIMNMQALDIRPNARLQ